MELQIALDRMPAATALDIVAAVAPHVDWIEVGTSMIKRDGAAFLAAVADAAGDTPVLADLKTADDARWELTMAYDAGARSATVLGLAPAATIDTAVQVARARDRELVVDLMGLDAAGRAALAGRLPADVVLAAHVSKDVQAAGASPLAQLGPWAQGRRIAVAGGLGVADMPALAGTDIRVIVGSAVTSRPDPLAAVQELRAAAGAEVLR
ncbi:orotidine 5'-phosphate decarboxylase [Mycolicibacterium mageritense DSM 44476 = CIP 104973]|uniref:3-hexulose-6-phosphate synthase n=2 Tax=Mycolicibacterium mageritense TaxID=53462 RepID=A0AAI8TLU5_MYCME|nr:orotidine 5'-phosphate decarboxylase / HUMPS family protein [Mycolicibacterium mageritense]TXI61856.1 MAG: 3-hexulose-6-phosphate synthase [Mycolicibacterium mageritense]CDO23513.1 3-hexulose-6-phosphate synthase [Mycolicibacterium mageritense DSM 44476 = CIP 104973]BBX31940.1 3-hexulose-6-phosphate synthase [Mycolicibacterium mageritense]BDY27093.1 3-hexulose-6-phosphate synthase [Mycolicibacterium mageritense]GJJ17840.1 3-hexulose-6-phosphate synthase [Mycolicibacterium mageritense]